MNPTSYESLAAFILTIDKMVLGFLLPIDFLLAVAVVALVSRERKPLEIVTLLALSWALFFAVTVLLFHLILNRPFMRLEVVQYPWIDTLATLIPWFASCV